LSLKPVVAQLAKQFKLNKKQANATLTAYNEERRLTPEYAQTLFGLTNAVTRAGQTLGNEEWLKLDQLGGDLISFDADDFSNLIGRAKSLREKEVDEMYAGAYLSE
jgi:Ser/Thr protein kinase RdoA (MazF antagonist)